MNDKTNTTRNDFANVLSQIMLLVREEHMSTDACEDFIVAVHNLITDEDIGAFLPELAGFLGRVDECVETYEDIEIKYEDLRDEHLKCGDIGLYASPSRVPIHYVVDREVNKRRAICGDNPLRYSTNKNDTTCVMCAELLRLRGGPPDHSGISDELQNLPEGRVVHYRVSDDLTRCGIGAIGKSSTEHEAGVTCKNCLRIMRHVDEASIAEEQKEC